ncbi:MAG: OmpA family protein [Saprospiraceae bacterium]|nr:OmpA family protein [Saprospiraceae bacterium]
MKTRFHLKSLYILLALSLFIAQACNTSKTVKGGAIGAAAGGAIGGVIGSKKGNTAAGVIIGAAIGGAAGALIGRYMDKQAKEIEQEVEGVEVERVGEGILLTFDSGLLFGFDSYELNSTTRANLNDLAEILKKYEDTEIMVDGHTDAKGTDEYNMKLSKNRANAVSNYLTQKGVAKSRFKVNGYGESRPVADNESDAGRQQNRRVEVALYANEELKKDAEKGDVKMK